MKKKLMSILIAMSMLPVLMPVMSVSAADISIGEYLQMGTYYGEPILWRCVDIDENGPLILSDKIICIKPFDAAGDNTSGSHGRGYDDGHYRKSYGSNYWADSNMRCWLNSSASAGNIEWSCGNPPTENKVWGGYNDYADEAGFLSNFSLGERNAIKSVTQKSLLDGYEYSSSRNSNYHTYGSDIYDVLTNYDTAYSEQVTDSVFLLDVKQLHSVYSNGSILGEDYYIGEPTAQAVDKSEYKNSLLRAGNKWYYYLRSPDSHRNISFLRSPDSHSNSSYVRLVGSGGHVYCNDAATDNVGVRPAFYLNQLSVRFTSGFGTLEAPYTVEGSGAPTVKETSLEVYCNEPSLSTVVGNVFMVGAGLKDENGNYDSPENITFDISDESILKSLGTEEYLGEQRYFKIQALKEGTTTIKIKDNATGQTGELPFTVNKKNGMSYTIYDIPNLDNDKNPNFNNFSGLYVDSFNVNRQSDGSAAVSFDVYNKNFTSAVVEVYNANGEMTDAELIEKCEYETSIKDVFSTMFKIGQDIWNGVYNPLNYKSSIQSKHTPIKNLTIPCGGYIKITPDTLQSPACGAVNGLDVAFQILSRYCNKGSSVKTENLPKEVLKKIKFGGTKFIKDFTEDYFENIEKDIFNKNVSSVSDLKRWVQSFLDMFSSGTMKELAVSVGEDSAVNAGASVAEDFFTKSGGPATEALNKFWDFSEVCNLIMQSTYFVKKAGTGAIVIQAPDGNTRSCSNVTVNCKMNNKTSLNVYRLYKDSIELAKAKKTYMGVFGSSMEGYNITLSQNGSEVQPEGKAEVLIDIPSYMQNGKNISVYRLEKDGGITDMKANVSQNKITFETEHFSTYILTADGVEKEPPKTEKGQTVINGDTIVSDWAAEEVQEAFNDELVPDILQGADLTKKVDRAEFAAIAVTLYENLSGNTAKDGENPFGDISGNYCENEILKAYHLGITNGITSITFEPSTLITREQVATMLTRAYKKSEWPDWTLAADGDYLLNSMGVKKFADDAEISDWAKESVYFMAKWNIINGIDDTHFAPKANTALGESYGYATREQAVVLALRSAKHL